MDTLREKIVEIVGDCLTSSGALSHPDPFGRAADRILSIPELAEALRLKPIKPMRGER